MSKRRILINGASGRIGRAVTNEIVSLADPNLDIIMLNDPVGADGIVRSLTKTDKVHGKYNWDVKKVDDNIIEINGKKILVGAHKSIGDMNLNYHGIDLVEECSGFYGDDKKDASKRLSDEFFKYGVHTVIQSYPANADAMLIMGINHTRYNPDQHRLISNGSCTTKALTPLRVLLDHGVGIEGLLMDTVHAATNSQGILDSLDQISTHKTGAAKALGQVIPYLQGKMDGLAFRVPTLDGSFANPYFVATYDGDLTAEKINDILTMHIGDEDYKGRIALTRAKEIGTIDIIGRKENGLVCTSKTRSIPLPLKDPQGKPAYLVGLVIGYDNEAAPPRDQALLSQYIASRD